MKALLPLFMLLLSCHPVMNTFNAARKDDDSNGKKTKEEDAEAEKVDIPTNIAGSYLMCSLRKDATDQDPSSEYGCRLNEEGTAKKLDLSAVQARIQWRINLSDGVSIDSNTTYPAWHAIYTIKASDLASLR